MVRKFMVVVAVIAVLTVGGMAIAEDGDYAPSDPQADQPVMVAGAGADYAPSDPQADQPVMVA